MDSHIEGRPEMRFWYMILFFILIPAYVQAETIVLVGRDSIHGEITEKTDSTITLVHEVFGRLETPNDQIASIIVIHDVLGEEYPHWLRANQYRRTPRPKKSLWWGQML
jgi:hypothetical protein